MCGKSYINIEYLNASIIRMNVRFQLFIHIVDRHVQSAGPSTDPRRTEPRKTSLYNHLTL